MGFLSGGGQGGAQQDCRQKKNLIKDPSEVFLSSNAEVSSGLCFKSLAGKLFCAQISCAKATLSHTESPPCVLRKVLFMQTA